MSINPRPLLPAAGGNIGREETPPPSAAKAARISTTACLVCRQKKHKCSGPPAPCRACIQKGTDCVFEEHLDKRRKAARKRQADEVNYRQRLLSDLLESIRSSNETDTQAIVELIKSQASLDDIAAFIAPHVESHQQSEPSSGRPSEEPEQPLRTLVERKYLAPSSRAEHAMMAQLERNPAMPLKVKARLWTRVTDDDYLVGHLLSLFFTWVNPCLRVVDEEAFLRDAQAGDTESAWCNPFVFNALLALGSLFSDLPQVLADQNDPLSHGALYLDEARRIWDVAEGDQSLNTLQGLYALVLNYFLRGKDKVAEVMMSVVTRMCKDILSTTSTTGKNAQQEGDQALHLISWSIFNLDTYLATFYFRPSLLEAPRMSRPYEPDTAAPSTWMPYPDRTPVLMNPHAPLFEATCDLYTRIWKIKNIASKGTASDKPTTVAQLEEEIQMVRIWYEHLPEQLKARSGAPLPVLQLHLDYYGLLAVICGSFQTPHIWPPEIENNREFAARQAVESMSCAIKLSSVLSVVKKEYGYERITPVTCQAASVASLILLGDLASAASQEAFAEALEALVVSCKVYRLSRGLVQMIRCTAREHNLDLPPDSRALLEEYRGRLWSAEDLGVMRSKYPNYFLARNMPIQDVWMEDLLRSWQEKQL